MKDRTTHAIQSQLRAMGCERYEIGIRSVATGQMLLRRWTAAEVEHAIGWLKQLNASNHDVYVRPFGTVGLIFLDDLKAEAIARLKQDGLAPACVVQSSPHNYHAWLRISQHQPIPQEVATAAARIVAERYGGDPNSADWRHFGRLSGLTNRKRQYTRDGKQPFVLLIEATGARAKNGALLLQEAEARVKAQGTKATPARTVPLNVSAKPASLRTPGEAYAHYAQPILARQPGIDESKLDFAVCCRIARSSTAVDTGYLQEAIIAGSPDLSERKKGHVEDYVQRTAAAVMANAEVRAVRERLAAKEGSIALTT